MEVNNNYHYLYHAAAVQGNFFQPFSLLQQMSNCYNLAMLVPVKKVRLSEIFLTFTKIGMTGFGGGMAIVAIVERVCVREKKWITVEEFMHALAFGQILGPFSLNVCTFTGYHLRGIRGGIIAATAFILPSFLLVTLLSWIYFTYQKLPQLQAALKGTNPVVIGLIVVVAIDMGRKQIKGGGGVLMALAAFGASVFFKLNAAWILFGAALWSLCSFYIRRRLT